VNARLKEFAISAAERVVRKEVKALRNALVKADGDVNELSRKRLTTSTSTHRDHVAETMRISSSAQMNIAACARGYRSTAALMPMHRCDRLYRRIRC
jgi:hypothetical protein